MITITPELGAQLAQLLFTRRRPIGDQLPARHLLALRAWVPASPGGLEGATQVIEWRATHAIEIREARCAKPCAITQIEIARLDGTGRAIPMWLHGGELRTRLVPPIRVGVGDTIKVTLASGSDVISAGEADLFYEPIP